MHRFRRFRLLHPHSMVHIETFVSVLLAVLILSVQSASAVTRFYDRSLFIGTSEPGATTSYTVTFGYHTLTTIGSIDMLFCNDPIPTDPCDPPQGLDVSHAVLSSQTGETGFSIATQTTNHIVLSRPPAAVGSEMSSYTFSGIVNPTDTSQSFSIRLSDYSSSNATGSLIDLGSVVSQVQEGLEFETQVPPILTFCLAEQVTQNCATSNGGNNSDLGNLDPNTTLTATSQMAVGTNAAIGYTITMYGTTMSAGAHGITALTTPTASVPGTNQFGVNLVANTSPSIGSDPDGASPNAVLGADYDTPNKFAFDSGQVVASAPNVSLVKRYTISYIVNSAANLTPGVYTTTLSFICTGRF